jgi:branched-chain amino acid transport system substrate-binding protein
MPAGRDDLVIGAVYPLTGPDAILGRNAVEGLKLGIDEVNAAGGVISLNGRRLRLEFGDHASSPERGARETEALVDRGARVVLGSWHSAVTMTASAAADRLRTPFLNAESLGDEISERGLRYVFRLVPSNKAYARATGQFLEDAMARTGHRLATAAILFEESWFGRTRAEALRREAEARGFRVVAFVHYPKPPPDLGPFVAEAARDRPDVLMQASYVRDAVEIHRTLTRLGREPRALIGHVTLFGPRGEDFGGGLPATGQHTLWTLGWWGDLRVPGVDIRGTGERFAARFGAPMDGNGALNYTAAWVVREVLEQAASEDRDAIRQAFTRVDIPRGDPHNLRHHGIRFGPDGQNVHAAPVVTQVIDGQVRSVWPFEVAAHPVVFPARGRPGPGVSSAVCR